MPAPTVANVNVEVEEYLRSEASERGVRDDWEVRTGPDGITVDLWTSDRFVHPEEATRVAHRVLRELEALGHRIADRCDVDAVRDVDGDWRGHLVVRLRPPSSSPRPVPDRPWEAQAARPR
jgi:hypothetical protein